MLLKDCNRSWTDLDDDNCRSKAGKSAWIRSCIRFYTREKFSEIVWAKYSTIILSSVGWFRPVQRAKTKLAMRPKSDLLPRRFLREFLRKHPVGEADVRVLERPYW